MGSDGRRLRAEQTTWCSAQVRALIRHGDLAIRRELAKDRVRGSPPTTSANLCGPPTAHLTWHAG
ncbi:hypothetical protein ACFQ7B_12110 [Streptomyces erythrochromogenes]|uniref:hypothetical protein n=1 Tax=Streptomyces erythrochromogenes TaxID=285574 RepID=UPI003675CB90